MKKEKYMREFKIILKYVRILKNIMTLGVISGIILVIFQTILKKKQTQKEEIKNKAHEPQKIMKIYLPRYLFSMNLFFFFKTGQTD